MFVRMDERMHTDKSMYVRMDERKQTNIVIMYVRTD